MDLQPLNILKADAWGEHVLKFIDFEYAGYNPRALDVANTWCEHCEMTDMKPDYDAQYPSPDQQRFFVKCYLSNLDPAGCEANKYDDAFVADFIRDVDRHSLMSHYAWLLWSVKQAVEADIEWDYYRYIGIRAKGYFWMKGKLGEAS
jgi:thiamine kinase-like enzyme